MLFVVCAVYRCKVLEKLEFDFEKDVGTLLLTFLLLPTQVLLANAESWGSLASKVL